MKIVVALGGNALLRRGQVLSAENQHENVKLAAKQLAKIKPNNDLVIAHGNGPQVGLLALKEAAYTDVPAYPLDILVAETVGMIGYLLQQELGNELPDTHVTTILSQIEVDPNDPAFAKPTKFIGPIYTKEQADSLAAEKGWDIAPDGDHFRRVVPSPLPQRLPEVDQVKWLVEKGSVVICCGGGAVSVKRNAEGKLEGVEAVVDKDLCTALLSENIDADLFVIATDVPNVYLDFANKAQAVKLAHPDELAKYNFPAGSMGPKVDSVIKFARQTGKDAVIGALADIEEIVKGNAGTRVSMKANGITYY